MPRYDITDPTSGKNITLEGDSPPTESELNTIFSKVNSTPQPKTGLQEGSDFFRNLGLGFIPNTAANITDIGKGIMNGRTDVSQGYSNPFRTQDEMQQQLKTNPVVSGLKDAAGAGAWGNPLGAEGMLARFGLGGAQGVLQGVSQPNATPQSVLESGGVAGTLNTVLPGLGNIVGKTLGRASLGKGGEALPSLIKESGNSIMGGAEDIKNNLYGLTQPIRDKLSNLLNNSKGAIKPSEVFGTSDDKGIQTTQGLLDSLISKLGHTEKGVGQEYAHILKSSFSDSLMKYLDETYPELLNNTSARGAANITDSTAEQLPGDAANTLFKRMGGVKPGVKGPPGYLKDVAKLGEQAISNDPLAAETTLASGESKSDALAKIMNDPHFELPLSFWNDFLHGVGRDVGNKWVNIQQGKFVPAQDEIGKKLYGWLRKEIADRSGNADQVNKLTGLLKSGVEINASLGKKLNSPGIEETLKNLGIPLEVIGALATGHPIGALGGIGAKVATSPKVATPIVNALQHPATPALQRILQGLGVAGIGEANQSVP